MSDDGGAVLHLDNPVQHYAWGSTTIIPALLGAEPTGDPVAELWLGAHPAAPSRVTARNGQTLSALIDEDPRRQLGPAVADRFGELPFLLKILAVARPLSLQAHPTLEQARAGFAAENAAGLALDSPVRNFRDANHKPELVCALTVFEGLCGFRPIASTLEFIDALILSDPEVDLPLLRAVGTGLRTDDGLAVVVTDLLTRSAAEIPALLEELVPATRRLAIAGGAWASESAWIVRLDTEYPGDRGAVMAVLLNLVRLQPGDSLFLHAGELHAYLSGVAVEVLANSDNVLRGGMTPKHIDVPALLEVLDLHQDVVVAVRPDRVVTGAFVYPSAVPDFRLVRLDLDDATAPISLAKGSPRIMLCTEGSATITSRSGEVTRLERGAGMFVPADVAVSVAETEGIPTTVFVALPNL